MSREYHGMNVSLALAMGLDREETYKKMSYTDMELSRRMWWLIYTGDRSSALSEGGRTMIQPDEMLDTAEPALG